MCNSISELIKVIEENQAEYQSVLLHKDNWAKIIAEIKELNTRPRFDTGTVFGREQMIIANLRAKGFGL